MNRVLIGDCRTVLRDLAQGGVKVQCVVTNPPSNELSIRDYINKCHIGDCREVMQKMIADGVRVQCVVTSPPYFGLRQYFANAVRIKGGLTAEKRAWVENQLREAGIHAHQ